MKRPPSKLKVRLAYEPNRFSTNALRDVYERLNPTKSRMTQKVNEKDKEAAYVDQLILEVNK